MPVRKPKALLFDLGGVLIDIDVTRAVKAWAPYSSLTLEELTRTFRYDDHFERHERGEIAAEEYFAYLASTLKLTATAAQVEEGWNSIYVGEFIETRQRIERLRDSVPCYALSNTNASHMSRWTQLYPEMVSAFSRIFVSHQIGRRKPERAVFEHVCEAIGAAPESVLFFDDVPEYVQAAAHAGLQSVVVTGPKDVEAALVRVGL